MPEDFEELPVTYDFINAKLTEGNKALLALAGMLEQKVTDEQFNMKIVFNCPDAEPQCTTECGSVGCVIGWAAHYDIFDGQLEIRKGNKQVGQNHNLGYAYFRDAVVGFAGVGTGDGELATFLGLNNLSDIEYLFGYVTRNPSRMDKVRQLRGYVIAQLEVAKRNA